MKDFVISEPIYIAVILAHDTKYSRILLIIYKLASPTEYTFFYCIHDRPSFCGIKIRWSEMIFKPDFSLYIISLKNNLVFEPEISRSILDNETEL